MNLLAVHRLLIVTFIAVALLFGALALARGGSGSVPAAAISGAVATMGVVYLLKARHLRRK